MYHFVGCAVIKHIYRYLHNYTVGSDYTTLTGQEDVKAVFTKGSNSAFMKILINYDDDDEDEENFTAEIQSDPKNTSATVIIREAVLCSFNKSTYQVFESVGSISLTLNSNRATPSSNYTVQVDTVYGGGNASSEYMINSIILCSRHDG